MFQRKQATVNSDKRVAFAFEVKFVICLSDFLFCNEWASL